MDAPFLCQVSNCFDPLGVIMYDVNVSPLRIMTASLWVRFLFCVSLPSSCHVFSCP